jgi:1,4-alpha-glucan branching enzyme
VPKFLLFFILISLPTFTFGQKVNISPTIDPVFFNTDHPITIRYEVTGTVMHSWTDAWLWLWVPNRNDLTVASNINPAASNPTATQVAKFTKSSDQQGRQFFTITLTLNQFITGNVSNITQVGMLLKGNDWSNGQTEDYLAPITRSFALLLDNPKGTFGFYTEGANIHIRALTSQPATITLMVNEETLATDSEVTELSVNHTVISDGQVHTLKAIATNGTDTEEKTFAYTITPGVVSEPVPAGMRDGINYHDNETAATLVLVAPFKQNVYVIGEFNDWQINSSYLMKKDGDRWWVTITGLTPGEEYQFQYLVDGNLRIADPYTEKVGSQFDDQQIINEGRYAGLKPYPIGKTTHELSYLQPGRPAYPWTATNYVRPAQEDLVIYELLIRDFTDQRTYKAVTEKLDYLKDLGINAIELLPVMEFEGNISWGYNPAFMLAPDKFYGHENDLKELIDEAHKRNMAIILDIALNHAFGRSPLVRLYNDGDFGPPTNQNPWLNRVAKHDFNVGYDFNHESQYTKDYVDRVVLYWMQEYKIDGYRFDLSKGFTQKNTLGNVGLWGQYDASRVALLKRIADLMWEEDPSSYVILEHFADNSEERDLANYGMMLWGNLNHNFINAARNNSNLNWLYHGERGWNHPHLIGYAESHDEERVMWEILKTMNQDRALQRSKLIAPFLIMVPGPKMVWQFGELGYQEQLNNDRLGIKPTRWEYLDIPARKDLYRVYAALNHLKTTTTYLRHSHFAWSAGESLKWMRFNNPDFKVVVFGNFSAQLNTTPAIFPASGTWYNYLTGEELQVPNHLDFQMLISSGEFQIFTSAPLDNNIDEVPVDFILGLAEEKEKGVHIYPNPSQQTVTIEWNFRAERMELVDTKGRVVQNLPISSQDNSLRLDVSQLPTGVYFLQIKNGPTNKTYRLLKN